MKSGFPLFHLNLSVNPTPLFKAFDESEPYVDLTDNGTMLRVKIRSAYSVFFLFSLAFFVEFLL